MVNKVFWKGKKVFITGHTGFKGSWLTILLESLGANIKGYSLKPNTENNLFELSNLNNTIDSEFGDIRNSNLIEKSIKDFDPDILFHLAAQPLVRESYENPKETYETNVLGTLNVLEGARKAKSLKSIIIVTTDKCYENKEWIYGYRETDPMGGYDPYSSSKGCCELLVNSYRNSFFNNPNSAFIASVRAGNVIGGGDWSKDRLIPDIINSFSKSKKVIIRNPNATRPWQHVLEPITGYMKLAELLFDRNEKYSGGWNFGPNNSDNKPVEYIVDKVKNLWGEKANWELDYNHNPHEANLLMLDISKARNELKWIPKWNIDQSLDKVVEWYKGWLNNEDVKKICINQIEEYLK